MRRARFLALDQQRERDRGRALAACGQRRAGCGTGAEGVEEHLALVVGGAAAEDLPSFRVAQTRR